MKIIVLDDRPDRDTLGRYESHDDAINILFPGADYDIKISFSYEEIMECDADLLIVHCGNDEFPTIEDTPKCGKIRIFFGGGVDTYDNIDGAHYVKDEKLYERLRIIFSEMSENDDS